MLTAHFVNTVTVKKRTDFPDTSVPGLVLRVTPTGVKTWSLRYRTQTGQAKRYTLGSTDNLTLSKARHKARQTLHSIAAGKDPAAEKRSAGAGATVGELSKDYLNKHGKVHKRSWRQDESTLDRDVLPYWKHRKVREITRRDVRLLLDRVVERGSPVSANRVLALVRGMFNFGIKHDWLEANPAALIPKPGKETSRERVLTEDEIRLFWQLCDQERPIMATFLRLRLLTAQRGGELAKIRWADVTEDAIVIPASVSKNKRTHYVPLSPSAKALIEDLPRVNQWVFPGRFDLGPMTDIKESGQRLNGRMTAILRQSDPEANADFRGHDLRRTAATYMAKAGIPQQDISRVLNHVEGGPKMTQVYQRYEFDKEKRIALETWDRVLTGILTEKDAKDVLPFARRK